MPWRDARELHGDFSSNRAFTARSKVDALSLCLRISEATKMGFTYSNMEYPRDLTLCRLCFSCISFQVRVDSGQGVLLHL